MTSSQMLKGVLEGCVLALIGRGETYGYELVGALAACGLPGIAEGTLYPLLMRLEKKGFIASVYRESEVGPRRKYYRITEAGAEEVGLVCRGVREFVHRGGARARCLSGVRVKSARGARCERPQ